MHGLDTPSKSKRQSQAADDDIFAPVIPANPGFVLHIYLADEDLFERYPIIAWRLTDAREPITLDSLSIDIYGRRNVAIENPDGTVLGRDGNAYADVKEWKTKMRPRVRG
jgi:hypothetical protein